MRRLWLSLLVMIALATPALGERLISTLSNENVDITSSFDGERMTFYGTVAPDVGSGQRFVDGPFHVIIAIVGPAQDRVAREKANVFGVWLNTDEMRFRHFPSYFHVLASDRLTNITDLSTLATNYILPEAHATAPNEAGWAKTLKFGRELVRLMTQQRLFGVQENAVNFLSDNFYSAQLTLPSHAPPGPYLALTYVFKNGEIIARKSEGFAVRKIGFERFLAQSAVQSPFFYGLACVVLALFTGWLGGLIFKR
ncbi:MAG: TIGR02186 family protein [Devosia sp.]|uniref:TIGR02186 family protein n=1 Tax=Devosia sp. TaxID=1871048 RepID=UPI0024CC4194|nr:TIGR02186 family protein [Devosia sp.]UYN99315.1 MAG: TIGR02186 family protein [Devosia sp.]